MIRLLLVDDQDLFRQGLAASLSTEDDLQVVEEASNGQDAIDLIESVKPDVILMDVRMPVCDGVLATRAILDRYPWVRILVLTTFDDDEYILRSLEAGALGYLLKRTPPEHLIAAIRSIHLGYSQLGPTIARKVFTQLKSLPATPISDVNLESLLSKAKLQVLKLICQGKTNQQIAQELHLSEGTVKNYVSYIFKQLGVSDRTQVVIWVQQHFNQLPQ